MHAIPAVVYFDLTHGFQSKFFGIPYFHWSSSIINFVSQLNSFQTHPLSLARSYNIRHTYATLMMMAGMNSAFCAGQLGHSVAVFHKEYAEWLDGDQNKREMALRENALIAPDLPQK